MAREWKTLAINANTLVYLEKRMDRVWIEAMVRGLCIGLRLSQASAGECAWVSMLRPTYIFNWYALGYYYIKQIFPYLETYSSQHITHKVLYRLLIDYWFHLSALGIKTHEKKLISHVFHNKSSCLFVYKTYYISATVYKTWHYYIRSLLEDADSINSRNVRCFDASLKALRQRRTKALKSLLETAVAK